VDRHGLGDCAHGSEVSGRSRRCVVLAARSGHQYTFLVISRRFVPTHEARLIEQFLASASAYKAKERAELILREVDCRQGRADVVRVRLGHVPSREVSEAWARVLSLPSAGAVLANLPSAPRTTKHLIARTGLSARVVQQRLDELQALDLVESPRSGTYRRTERVSLLEAAEVSSFEAKMNGWQRALYQAAQYRGFSHRASVVMPAPRARAAIASLESFRRLGIGLVLVDSDVRSREVLRPRHARPFSKPLFYLALGRAYQAFATLDACKRAKRSDGLRPVL